MRHNILAFAAVALFAGSLTACASNPFFDNPQDSLNTITVAVETAEATYDTICSVQAAPAFCAQDAAAYMAAKIAMEAAIQTAQTAIDAGDGSTSIQALIQTAEDDYLAYLKIVNATKAKNAAYMASRGGS